MKSYFDYASQPIADLKHPLDRAMAREVMTSERLRMATVAVFVLSTLIIYVAIVSNLTEIASNSGLNITIPLWLPIAVFLIGLSYEVVAYTLVGRLLQQGRQMALWVRYVNALVETSFPTIIIAVSSGLIGPTNALSAPPSLAYFLFVVLATLRLDAGLCVFTGLVAATEYFFLARFLLGDITPKSLDMALSAPLFYFGKSVLLLAGGILAGIVARQLRRQFARTLEAVQERQHVVEMFGQYVSPAVVDILVTQKVEIQGEMRHVCMMFLDIRDFTAYSEKRNPADVVRYLNTLFAFMVEIVNQHNGMVNKFLGDGFMAVFGAPLSDGRDVQNAVTAAQALIAKVNELSAAGHIPLTRVGIGLHAGEAVTGNVGSAERKEYTIIGDVVNLASRIEQLNKQFGSQVLVSEAVWQTLQPPPSGAKPLGPVMVKGHAEPVPIYQLI